MPEQNLTTTYLVFLASPDDVSDERKQVEKVIEKINRFFEDRNIQFKLINWESMRPGYGKDSQSVIENQIPQFDIFIGIMWLTVGGSDSSKSGTIREFNMAQKRLAAGELVDIFFYFKDQPVSPIELNVSNLAEVQKFKSEFQEQGHYKTFASAKEFEELLEANLIDYIKNANGKSQPNEVNRDIKSKSEDDEDLGLYDLSESVTTNSNELVSDLENIQNITNTTVDKLNQRISEINSLKEDTKNYSQTKMKRVFNTTAHDMNVFCTQMNEELPDFEYHLSSFTNISDSLIGMLLSFNEDHDTDFELSALRDPINDLIQAMTTCEKSSLEAIQSIQTIPRLTTQLNKAKRRTIKIYDELIRIIRFGISELERILKSIGDTDE